MARPRLDEQERRARTVGVRGTATEAAELRERAQAARLSMGALPWEVIHQIENAGLERSEDGKG